MYMIGRETRAAGDASWQPMRVRDAVPRPTLTGRFVFLSRSDRVACFDPNFFYAVGLT